MKRKFSLIQVIKEIFRGKSISRAIQNSTIQSYRMNGTVADLGSRDGKSSIYRFIDTTNAKIEYFDYYGDNKNIKKIDLEKKLPIDDKKYDYTLLIHVLECIYNTDQLLNEIKRITKVESLIIVPFFVGYHGDPNDYYRFTHDALNRKFKEANYSKYKITPYGFGNFTMAINILGRSLKFRTLISLFFILAVILDSIVFKIKKNKGLAVMGYIVKANP